jgi:(R,R)-butanediol dehydrogenase / meso-butanediol dehydrogenase / diacetyl reductase
MTAVREDGTRMHSNPVREAVAARYHGVGDVRVERIEIAPPGPGEVTLAVAYAGICGSDLHEYFSGQVVTPKGSHPLTGATLPVVLGHEFSGTVVAVGSGVTDRSVGDRVAARPTYHCGTCPSCVRGHENSCSSLAFHGLSAHGGGLSTFTNLRAEMTFVLPASVSLLQGALVEPMAVARHGVSLAVHANTDVALVSGVGPIGIGALFALRDMGVRHVIAADLAAGRRDLALEVGASEVFDPSERSIADVLAGRVLDVVVEAAGVAASVTSGVSALGPRGRMVLLGMHERPMQFDPTSVLYREVSLIGSSTYTDEDFEAVIAGMAAGGYSTLGWVETREMAQLETAFEDLRAQQATKILLRPGAAQPAVTKHNRR